VKIALISLDAGVPRTLATTAFISALADGLVHLNVPVRVVGLVRWEQGWRPEALSPFDAVAPWLSPSPPRLRDAFGAAWLGILDDTHDEHGFVGNVIPDWYLELLLDRELVSFANGDELTLVVYPIYLPVLRASIRVARRRGWKLIVQSCEAMSGSWIDPDTRDDYICMVANSADGVWALSEYLERYWVAKGLAPERVIIQPNIVRESAFSTAPRTDRHDSVYLGNLQHREIEYLVEIASLVRQQMPAFTLRIYGDASEERRTELAALISARGLGETISLEPAVQPIEVPDVLAGADVLLLPRSSGEFSAAGFPNKLGEYLASARPVVVTRVGDIPRYLTDQRDAYLVEPDDCQAFADAVVRALSSPADADRIGRAGRIVAAELLASPAAAKRIVDFIAALPEPVVPTAGLRKRFARVLGGLRAALNVLDSGLRRRLGPLRQSAYARVHSAVHRFRYTRQGHTRGVALKMLIVRVLRFMHLKPPESRP
jgi:glycosyltransferase involved in cell wall biosynthesis